MTARADDRIWWVPTDYVRGTLVRMSEAGYGLLHRCPTAVVITDTYRDVLDPMALGLCRYCKEPLP